MADYSYDPNLCLRGNLVVVAKNLKQQAMTLGQTLSVQKNTVLGGEQIRKYTEGIIASFELNTDEITSDNINEIAYDLEPCGLDVFDSFLVYATGDRLKVCDTESNITYEYMHPWFASLHSVEFSPDKKHLLVASTGFDTAFEIKIETGEVTWSWNAWENFYSQSRLGHHVVNDEWLYDSLLFETKFFDEEIIHIRNPKSYRNDQGRTYGIPAKYRSEHLNTACYFGEDKILITFFHSGRVLVIDKQSHNLDTSLLVLQVLIILLLIMMDFMWLILDMVDILNLIKV